MGRVEWLDVAKGIGILMVIVGHCIQYELCRAIYSVHLPLFFFVSGILFSQSKYNSWSLFLKSRINAILKPFCVIWLISLAATLLIPQWRERVSIQIFFSDFYLATPAMVNNTSIWFLVCLFFTFLISFFIFKLLKNTKLGKPYPMIFFIFFMVGSCYIVKGMTAVEPFISIPYGRLPFKIDTALIASVFFVNGNQFKDIINNYVSEQKYFLNYDIWLLCVIWLLGSYVNSQVNLHAFLFGNAFLFYITSFAGILFLSKLSQLIVLQQHHIIKTLKHVLGYYGTNSLIIFGFQSLFLHLYVYFCNNYIGTDLVLYSANPIIHQLMSLILTTFVFTPLVVAGVMYLRKNNVKLL